MTQVVVLHRWPPDDRRAVDGVSPHRHRGHVHLRVEIGQRVKARVIAERPLGDERLARVDVPLDHELRLGRHLEIAGQRLRQLHRLPSQESGEDEFVDRRRERGRRGVHRRGVGADRDHDRHRLTALCHLPPVRGAYLVALPVHRQRPRPEKLHAIHADVPNAALWILRDDHRQRDVRPAVLRPALDDRELPQVHLVPAPDDLLRRRRPSFHARRELGHLEQPRQHAELGDESLRHLHLQQLGDAVADLVEPFDAERHRHPPHRPEEIDCHRERRAGAVEQRHVLEEERGSSARLLHGAVGDLAELEVHRHGLRDADELARLVEPLHELAEGVEAHARTPT